MTKPKAAEEKRNMIVCVCVCVELISNFKSHKRLRPYVSMQDEHLCTCADSLIVCVCACKYE